MAPTSEPLRERGYADFSSLPAESMGGQRRWLMRAQNFTCEWFEGAADDAGFAFESDHETLLLGVSGALRTGGTTVPADAFAILPAGRHVVQGGAGATGLLIASRRADTAGRRMLNAGSYAQPDARIAPTGRPFRRKQPLAKPQVLPISEVMASPDKPRLKMLQTETLSINVVDYSGPRDRRALSPHSHKDFEQASFAVHGNFVHHLRTPWGSNADQWRDDEHLQAPSPSMVVVPVEVIHTTEGLGEGRHLLLDVFSPPRFDFIGNGWVFNAGDYEAA